MIAGIRAVAAIALVSGTGLVLIVYGIARAASRTPWWENTLYEIEALPEAGPDDLDRRRDRPSPE